MQSVLYLLSKSMCRAAERAILLKSICVGLQSVLYLLKSMCRAAERAILVEEHVYGCRACYTC